MLGLTLILRKIWLGREGSGLAVGLVPERCQCLQGGAVVGAGLRRSKYSAQMAGREQTCRFCMCLAVGRQSVAARNVAPKLIDIG